MSSSIGAIRFNDGSIKYYKYHGTSDIAERTLRDTKEPDWYDKCET